jgi:hypothetical protein
MALELNSVANTTISNITYNNILQDVYNLIEDNSALKSQWTDFISSDAGRMLTELFAWISQNLAEKIDLVGNELFLETAESKESKLRLLKLIGYKLDFPTSASTKCSVSIRNGNIATESSILLSQGAASGNSIALSSSSFKKLTNSNTGRSFEFISYDETEKKYKYFEPIFSSTRIEQTHVLQEGETKSYPFTVSKAGYFTIQLSGPVIKNSVSIFATAKNTNESFKELLKVDNFFSREAQTSTVPVYKVNNLGNGVCEIEFPNKNLNIPSYVAIGEQYTVLYRVGGGEEGNIEKGSLYTTEQILLSNGTIRGYITYTNTENGIGGIDELSSEELTEKAPQEIRNYSSAITAEDYEYILKRNNETLKDVKVYGEYNIESSDIEEVYGNYKSPLDVWLFMIREKSGFSYDIDKITDYINDICFNIFDINERMNEVYQIKKADLNVEVSPPRPSITPVVLTIAGTNYTIHNPISISSSEKVKTKITATDSGYKIVFTKYPFEEKKVDIVPNQSNKEYLVNDENETDEDGYPIRYLSTINSVIKEDFIPSISYSFPETFVSVSDSDSLTFTVDGTEITINFTDYIFSSLSEFADFVNSKISEAINNTDEGIVLYENIVSGSDIIDSSVSAGSTVEFKISNSLNETITRSFTRTASMTWSQLVSALETALNETGYVPVLAEKIVDGSLDCYNLVIYNENEIADPEFLIDDYGEIGLLGDFLSVLGPLYSDSRIKQNETTTELIDIPSFFVFEDGAFTLSAGSSGSTIVLENSSLVKKIFGITEDSFETDNKTYISGSRILCFDENKNYIIGMEHINSRLPETIYISSFWESVFEIELGSYYHTLIDSDTTIPTNIKPLLKRGPIKYLYNTVFTEFERGVENTIPDMYNSNYEVKITRDKITGNTFERVGNIEAPPKLQFVSSTIPMSLLDDDYFLLRVNNIDLAGVTVGTTWDFTFSGVEIIDSAEYLESGYVKINVGKMKGKSSVELSLNIVSDIFSSTLIASTNTSGIPYLQTNTNLFYSCIDTTGTSELLYSKLFIGDAPTAMYSTGAIISATQIQYKKFTFNKMYFPSNKEIVISGIFNASSFSRTVNTSISFETFKANVLSDSTLFGKVIWSGDELFFTSKKINDSIKISIPVADEEERDVIRNFILDFVLTEIDVGTMSVEKINNGHYYIERNDAGKYILHVQDESVFPYGDIFFHMMEDYRGDHIVSVESSSDITYTDEYVWEKTIAPKKMLCVSHIYKQPIFVPFDMEVDVFIYQNAGLNKQQEYKQNIEEFLRGLYNPYTAKTGEILYKNKLGILIEKSLPNIASATVSYLGFDLENKTNGLDELPIKFNQKGIIASNKTRTTTSSGSTITVYEHGIKVNVGYL